MLHSLYTGERHVSTHRVNHNTNITAVQLRSLLFLKMITVCIAAFQHTQTHKFAHSQARARMQARARTQARRHARTLMSLGVRWYTHTHMVCKCWGIRARPLPWCWIFGWGPPGTAGAPLPGWAAGSGRRRPAPGGGHELVGSLQSGAQGTVRLAGVAEHGGQSVQQVFYQLYRV